MAQDAGVEILVRVVTPADADGLRALLEASYGTLLRDRYDADLFADVLPRITEPSPWLLASPTYYVATKGGQALLGCGGWSGVSTPDGVGVPGVGRIRRVAVHPDHLRRGVGSAIMREVERTARLAGITRLECNAAYGADSFYRRLGYVPTGGANVTLVARDGLPSVRMAKILD